MAFLENATQDQLVRAIAENHRQSFVIKAQESGGDVHRLNGVTWVYNPEEQKAFVMFPQMTRAQSGEQLDEIVAACRRKRLLNEVMVWSLLPTRPADLGGRLAARGFERGWQPHWMVLDVSQLRTDYRKPERLVIRITGDDEEWVSDDIPYGRSVGSQRGWHFGAFVDGRPVGHCSVFISNGRLGMGGIYGTGVSPAARRQGIGRAVTLTACAFAKEQGCQYVGLNATGQGTPVYASGGFVSVGYGQTWFLKEQVLRSRGPSAKRIALVEAVGRGDLKTLEVIKKGLRKQAFNIPLPTGETLVELAAVMDRPRAVSWLVEQGAILDVVSAWRLGWQDRIPALLAENPGLKNWHAGRSGVTPLHEAALENNVDLARAVLDADPDLGLAIGPAGTPLHQAGWLGHVEVVALLLGHGAPLEALNRYGGTPLTTTMHGALHSGRPRENHYRIVQALLQAGADVNGGSGGAMRAAATGNLMAFANLFLTYGPDLALTDPEGQTALDLAKRNGHSEIAELLKKYESSEIFGRWKRSE